MELFEHITNCLLIVLVNLLKISIFNQNGTKETSIVHSVYIYRINTPKNCLQNKFVKFKDS